MADVSPSAYAPAPVGRAEVAAAAERITGHVRRTPVLNISVGGVAREVVLKLDLLQPTGSFKVRGATSLLASGGMPSAGVVAASGGNFGLAVAWASTRLGVPAHIVVPSSSPSAKIDALREFGTKLTVVDGWYADALATADMLVADTGAMRAHAYDDRAVVAGQGTLAAELAAQAAFDTVVVACGGGGLLAGIVGWLAGQARVIAIETHGTPTLSAALEAGRPVDVEVSGVAASSLGARRIGDLAWAARDGVHDVVLVTDDDVFAAQRWLWDAARLVTEPGGAAAFAALLSGAYVPAPTERVAVVVCGANTDPSAVVAG